MQKPVGDLLKMALWKEAGSRKPGSDFEDGIPIL
jgi:hypothetical protein